jgi:hypothetical protein
MSEKSPFTLSTAGLSMLPIAKYPNDFIFIIDGNEFQCSSVVADFLSPRIARLHNLDPSLNYYEFANASDGNALQTILKLAQGHAIDADKLMAKPVLEVAAELENAEICSLIPTHVDESLSPGAIVERYNLAKHLHVDLSEMVEFIASHFFFLSDPTLQSLDYDDLRLILSDAKLRLKSEDSLFQLIASRYPDDPAFFSLMEYVYFDFLSEDSVKQFVAATLQLPDSSFWFNSSIWKQIGRRLVLSVSPQPSTGRPVAYGKPVQTTQCAYSESAPLNGILAFLTARHASNLHESGIVTVTASSSTDFKQFTDPLGSGYVEFSSDATGSWFCHDFKERRVTLAKYTIRSCCTNLGPKSWTIDGSNDGQAWETIHTVNGCGELASGGIIRSFEVSTSKACRFIRFRQSAALGSSTDGHIRAYELFGTLEE